MTVLSDGSDTPHRSSQNIVEDRRPVGHKGLWGIQQIGQGPEKIDKVPAPVWFWNAARSLQT